MVWLLIIPVMGFLSMIICEVLYIWCLRYNAGPGF